MRLAIFLYIYQASNKLDCLKPYPIVWISHGFKYTKDSGHMHHCEVLGFPIFWPSNILD